MSAKVLPIRLSCSPKCWLKFMQKTAKQTREFSVKFDSEKLLNCLANSSIKPFLSFEELSVIEPFLNKKNELKSNYNFTIDEGVAKNVAEKILSGCTADKTVVVEGNPGVGLITFNLIKLGVPHMLVLESSAVHKFSLCKVLEEYPNKVTKKQINMNIHPGFALLSAIDFGQKHGLPWTFVGIVTNFCFLKYLVLASIKCKLWEHTIDVYLLMNDHVLNTLRNRRSNLKLFFHYGLDLLYTTEELATYPRSAFLPYCERNAAHMTLVRIKNNQNMFELVAKEQMNEYFTFVEILGRCRQNFIIPTLEKWLPDCGPYLIAKGISMTNKVCDLSPRETIQLFNFFKECNGYEEFKICSVHLLAK